MISIHVQYAQLVLQFVFEDTHAKQNRGHEVLHCCTYAQWVLNQLGIELDQFKG